MVGTFEKLGIVITYSYHCNRCNHVWFPRDFDATFSSSITIGPDIAQYPRPKACARVNPDTGIYHRRGGQYTLQTNQEDLRRKN